jgi:cell division ATPase FtsA
MQDRRQMWVIMNIRIKILCEKRKILGSSPTEYTLEEKKIGQPKALIGSHRMRENATSQGNGMLTL